MKLITTDELNLEIANGEKEFIEASERKYQQKLDEIAEVLKENLKEKPLILLSGPSGSGKTTTALRLEHMLDTTGFETHTLSMDSYFLPVDETPHAVNENGIVDFESPLRMDIELLNKHLEQIANCEEVEIPKFNFIKQKREHGKKLKRKPNEFVVIEGIHALNPDITGKSYDFSTGLYVSIRTRLQNTQGELLHPSKIRVMRRLMRDVKHRGRLPQDTLDMFKSVERGENLYIMPYKHRAHFELDTFFDYEIPLYRNRLIPVFEQLSKDYADYERFKIIPSFLNELNSVGVDNVPTNSLIREFIGGSALKY